MMVVLGLFGWLPVDSRCVVCYSASCVAIRNCSLKRTAGIPRIPEHNPRYRTKEVIAADLALVLNSPLSYGTKFAVASDICWVWTEFDGKIKGCKYWSKSAVAAYTADSKAKLIHEHVVPKSIVIRMLFDLQSPTDDDVYTILERYLVAVVVTPEEDAGLSRRHRSTMPSQFFDETSGGYQDIWLRYKQTPIEVIEQATGKPAYE